jgi:hypothetical protein
VISGAIYTTPGFPQQHFLNLSGRFRSDTKRCALRLLPSV